MTEADRYEYLVTYRNPSPALLATRRGRAIKQTRKGADNYITWARNRGYDVRIQKRSVGPWGEA